MEGDSKQQKAGSRHSLFLSTPSGWRATTGTYSYTLAPTDFYPRPPGGGRPGDGGSVEAKVTDFYPRPPGGGRRANSKKRAVDTVYFYPRPPGGGRRGDDRRRRNADVISIHALRVEGDCALRRAADGVSDFYPRPPGGGRQGVTGRDCQGGPISIHALRVEGDSLNVNILDVNVDNFYPRPPGGGRRHRGASERRCGTISIHALRVEGDGIKQIVSGIKDLFLSTPSGWRATHTPKCSRVGGC